MRTAYKPVPVQFPLELPMRYKASLQETTVSGVSHTKWIGSKEIAFPAGEDLRERMRAVISIAWPFLLEDRVRLQLSVEAVVMRVEFGIAVARIGNYHFRTRGEWEPGTAPVSPGELDSSHATAAPSLSLAAGAAVHA